MYKIKSLLSRHKGYMTAGAAGLVMVAPFANAADGDVSQIVAGLVVTTAIAGVIAAATLKGQLNIVIMGAKRVLGLIR